MYSTRNSAQGYVAAWVRRGFGEEWIHIYVWLSPFAIHLKLSQHCESVIQDKKFKKMNKQTKQNKQQNPPKAWDILPLAQIQKRNILILFYF